MDTDTALTLVSIASFGLLLLSWLLAPSRASLPTVSATEVPQPVKAAAAV
jgi:hypothetical protein